MRRSKTLDLRVRFGFDDGFIRGELLAVKIDARARVLREADRSPLPNVFAGGGAARGVSGPEISGYLSGNGLLTAVVLGRIAGREAAALLTRQSRRPAAP